MMAIIAMFATIRDGNAAAGRTPVERIASSNPVGGRIASMIVFRKRPATKAMPIQRAAASTCGIAARISLSIAVAGPEIALDLECLERGDRNRDDDQRIDEDADCTCDAGTGRAGSSSGGTASGDARTVPSVEPMPIRARRPSTLAAISTVSTSRLTIRATTRPRKKISPAAMRCGRKAKISVTSSLIGARIWPMPEEL